MLFKFPLVSPERGVVSGLWRLFSHGGYFEENGRILILKHFYWCHFLVYYLI